MKKSPLKFAREFEGLRSELTGIEDPEGRLLLLMDFWTQLSPLVHDSGYKAYLDEYIQFFRIFTGDSEISDFNIEELYDLKGILEELGELKRDYPTYNWIDQKTRICTMKLATTLFYVGDVIKALPICCEISGVSKIEIPDLSIIENLDSFNSLRVLTEYYRNISAPLTEILQDIYDRWEAERECSNDDSVLCLFVEKSNGDKPIRGRLKVLKGIVKPDDRFIGVAYDSLKAVRKVLSMQGLKSKANKKFRAYFSIADSGHTFTGDSIGISIALVAYTQLHKSEITRQRRLTSNEVAITGGMDAEGNILPVNEETLKIKIQRAFYSPVTYVVVPDESYGYAREIVKKLMRKYLRRQLQIIVHSSLEEVISNYNILRSEKVCMGEYIVKKSVKYSRATKIQMPLILLLLYLLTCLIYPKAWIFLDRNPQYLNYFDNGFKVYNADSTELWSKQYDYKITAELLTCEIADINNDNFNEILIFPKANHRTDENDTLFAYGRSGNLIFRRSCGIIGEYPGDESGLSPFQAAHVHTAKLDQETIIITEVAKSHPARNHFRFWDAAGECLGWYINAGGGGLKDPHLIQYDNNKILVGGINNRMGKAAIFLLPLDSCFGVSPPYFKKDYLDLTWVKRGNQLCYIVFPLTDIEKLMGSKYNDVGEITLKEDGKIVQVNIVSNRWEPGGYWDIVGYFIDDRYRVISVSASDLFRNSRNRFVAEGKIGSVDWAEYEAELLDSVLYWTDSGWVSEAQLRAEEISQ
jgi:hypothetical protein